VSGKNQVLVADDNAHVLHATSDLIAEFDGVEIVSLASNVEEAIGAAARSKPDIAFIDAYLSGGGAEVAVRKIKSVSPATSIVVLASVSHLELVLRMRAAGAVGCYEKENLILALPEILASEHRR
jgi:two-component system, NarL family, response regulator DesR